MAETLELQLRILPNAKQLDVSQKAKFFFDSGHFSLSVDGLLTKLPNEDQHQEGWIWYKLKITDAKEQAYLPPKSVLVGYIDKRQFCCNMEYKAPVATDCAEVNLESFPLSQYIQLADAKHRLFLKLRRIAEKTAETVLVPDALTGEVACYRLSSIRIGVRLGKKE